MSLRSLAGQTAIYGISSIVARLLNYLLTPYLTRLLTPSQYGVITDMYALIPFAMVLLTMGFETGYFRFAGKAESEEQKDRLFSTAWGAVSIAALLFFVVVSLFCMPIAEVMGYATTPSYVIVVAGIILLDVVSALPFARLREQGRAGFYVLMRILSIVVNLVLTLFFFSLLPSLAEEGGVWGFIYFPEAMEGYVFWANLFASLICLLALLPGSLKVVKGFDKGVVIALFVYSFPLLLSGITGTANEFIDRQMIKYIMPATESMAALGIYGAVVKIGVVMLLFTQMYRLAAEPFFLSGFSKEDFIKTNAEAMKYFIMVSMGIFLGITLFSDLFALIVGAEFREGIYILPVVLLSNMFSGVVLNLSFWYKLQGRTSFALYITATGLVFSITLNILLIPVLGYFGAALARLCCEIVMVVLSYLLNRRYCPTPYNLQRIAEFIGLGLLLYGVSMVFVESHIEGFFKILINVVLLFVYALFAIRRECIDVVGLVKTILKLK